MVMYHIDNTYIETPLKFGDILIYQAGTLYCSPSMVIHEHNHINLFELTIVTDGEGEIIINGESVAVKKSDIHLSFPCDSHSIRSDFKNPLKYDFFSFSTENEDIKYAFERIMQANISPKKRIFTDDLLRTLAQDIIAELNNPQKIFSEDIIYSSAKLIIIRTVTAFLNESKTKNEFHLTTPKALCHSVKNYIDTHIYTIKNLSELSKITGYNYSYLSALFKRTTSETLADYFSNRRIEVAKQLLKQDFTVSKTAELLNYSSVYAFSKAFHKKCGKSPKEFKKEL